MKIPTLNNTTNKPSPELIAGNLYYVEHYPEEIFICVEDEGDNVLIGLRDGQSTDYAPTQDVTKHYEVVETHDLIKR